MRVLYCLVDGEKDYTPISDELEKKISHLIQQGTIPPSFYLGKKKIVSDTIIGFTDNPSPDKPLNNGFKDFRAKVLNSEWYQRAKKNRLESSSLEDIDQQSSSVLLPRGVQDLASSLVQTSKYQPQNK